MNGSVFGYLASKRSGYLAELAGFIFNFNRLFRGCSRVRQLRDQQWVVTGTVRREKG